MMKKMTLCGVLMTAAAVFAQQKSPWDLTVEYASGTVFTDSRAPRLGWKTGAEKCAKDVAQSAYRILVASSKEKLARGEADLWDSGKVAGGDASGVAYSGKALATSQRCWWKVMTWDAKGAESPWSEPQEWICGVMDPADWKAKWIGPAAITRPDEDFGAARWITAKPNDKGTLVLESKFDWDGGPGLVEMVHAGISQHEIRINGIVANKWSGHVHDWRYVRFRDIVPYLQKGENKILVYAFADVPNDPKKIPYDKIRKHAPAGTRAFIAKITFPDGRVLATGSESWTSPFGKVEEIGSVREPSWGKDMVLRTENASPAFAKEFTVKKSVASAVLHVTGAGYYEASLNGSKIGERVLDPSPTAFDKRMLYTTYSLDGQLREGANELRILVGHGWYDMRSIATWNFETSPWRDFPRCIAQLDITYADGTKDCVVTDKTWRQVKSPVGHDDIFEGEVTGAYDPRMPDLEGKTVYAEEVSGPKGRLSGETTVGSKVVRTLDPKRITDLGGGEYLVDFGENIAGWVRLDVGAAQKKGDVVTIRYDERTGPFNRPAEPSVCNGISNGKNPMLGCRAIDYHHRYTASHRVCAKDAAFQTDRLVCSGKAERFEPRFVYHGFRYAYIKGLREPLKACAVKACEIRTAFPVIGEFESSDHVLNTLMAMGDLAYRGNFANGVPTDCPHREKNGWTGDASVASELAQYQYENTAGYEKWIRDIIDAQLPNGNIPGIVPSSGWGYLWGNGPGWDSALSVIPWNLWIYRGDRRILDEVYAPLCKYLGYTATLADADGLVKHGLGDWIHVVRDHMPKFEYTSSCFYYQAQRIAAEIASLKGLAEDAAKWNANAEKTRKGINAKYYKGNGIYDNGRQTAQAFALAYGIPEPSEKKLVEAKLVESVEMTDCHVDFGLFGSKQVFRALSRIGRTDLAYKLLVNPSMPSMTKWIARGGTTLWEDWNEGASQNHIMFGDFVAWAYQYLAGIRPEESEDFCAAIQKVAEPGFKRITIAPQIVEELRWVRGKVNGPNGVIESAWYRRDGKLYFEFTVPPNTVANVILPSGKKQTVGSGVWKFEE